MYMMQPAASTTSAAYRTQLQIVYKGAHVFGRIHTLAVLIAIVPIITIGQEISITAKGVDASIQNAKAELCFETKFELKSAWTDVLSTEVNEDLFSAQNDPELERAHGEMVVGRQAGRYEFLIDSPFHLTASGTNFYSSEYAWKSGVRLQYTPIAVSVEGLRLKESLVITGRQAQGNFQGSFFCPYWSMGLFQNGLFNELQENRSFMFAESRERSSNSAKQVLRINASRTNPAPYSIDWFFDDSESRPVLLEIREPQRVTTFDKYLDLKCGIRFPMEATTVRGPFIVENKPRYHVSKWTFVDFVEGEPSRDRFEVNFSKSDCVSGYDVDKGATSLNILDIKPDKIHSSAPDQMRSVFSQKDEQFNKKVENGIVDNGNQRNWLLICLCLFGVIVASVAFLTAL
jgi:hypothetical protein